ncbi:MAG: acetolactate synthase small subunit, partial [Victivallaceae bacterium]
RELALFKIRAETPDRQSQVIQLVEIFKGKIVSVQKNEFGIEIAGSADKIDNFMKMVEEFGILEMARSGRVAISRDSGEVQVIG